MVSLMFLLSGGLLLAAFLIPLPFINFNIGSAAGLFLGAVLILWGLLRKRAGKRLKRAVCWILGLGFSLIAVLLCFMLTGGARKPREEQTLVVLGCRVYGGGRPSLMLSNRIQTAAAYLKAHPEVRCICSGGKGADEPISEAECIYRELVKAGIGEERLLLEDESENTEENLAFSRRLLEENGLPLSVTVVTNDFHCYRSLAYARAAGLEAYSLPAPTAGYLKPTYYLRECFAILWLWVS